MSQENQGNKMSQENQGNKMNLNKLNPGWNKLNPGLKILHITPTNMAYSPHRFADLTNKYTPHQAKVLLGHDFFGRSDLYNDLILTDKDEFFWWLENADVLHFHGSDCWNKQRFSYQQELISLASHMKNKRISVLHYHGSPQRERYQGHQKSGIKLLVSTPEMQPLFPGSVFFPNLIDERSKIYQKRKLRQDDKIRICHHFSFHRRLKNTALFMMVRETLCNAQLHEKIDLQVIEKLPLIDALARRAEFDAVFDHLQGYYGLVSIEGMAQGLLVFNGCGERRIDTFYSDSMASLKEFFQVDRIPFFIVNSENLCANFKTLTREVIEEYSLEGLQFMRNVWSGEKNIHRLIDFYLA